MRRGVVLAAGAVAIVLACLLAYAPTRSARFIQDDHPIVQQNPIVHRGSVVEIFSTDYWNGVAGGETSLYRPVAIGSFALERGADGKVDPARAHRTNVLLHALASLLLAALALRIGAGRAASLLAGALFALHPVHVSVVAGLVGRAEILAALFSFAALLLLTTAGPWSAPGAIPTRGGPVLDRVAAWGAGLCVFLALGSKEVALATPFLLVAAELAFRLPSPPWKARDLVDRAAALAPSVLAVALHGVLRLHALGVFPAVQRARLSENLLVGLEGVERLATALGLAARYFLLLLFPIHLSADYSGAVIAPERGLLSPLPLAGGVSLLFLALIAAAPVLLYFARSPRERALRAPSFASLLFLLPYLAVGNLFVLVGIGFAERLVYLPSAGFCLLLAMGARHLFALDAPGKSARKVLGMVLLAGLLGWWGLRAHRATLDWQTDRTVFEAVLRTAPASPRAQFTVGKIRLEEGRTDEALRFFTRAVEVWPDYSAAWYEKGRLELARGDRAGAARSFREAVRKNPGLADAGVAAGDLLFDGGRYLDAARFYARAARAGRQDAVPKLRDSLARAGFSAGSIP